MDTPQNTTTPVTPTPANTNGGATSQSTKPIIKTPMQKKGQKISPKTFAIGCIIFLAIFVGAIFLALYYGVQNPSALSQIGLNPVSAKSLLMIITGVFFGGMFFVSFAFLGLNGYRLSKAKNTPKTKFIVGMFVALIFLGLSIGLGAGALMKIKAMVVESISTDSIVIPYVTVYDQANKGSLPVWTNQPGIAVVAPTLIKFKINTNIFTTVLSQKVGVNTLTEIKLSCGNDDGKAKSQIIVGSAILARDSDWFDAPCLYSHKGTYQTTLMYTILEKASGQKVEQTLPAVSIPVNAEIGLTNDGIPLKRNDAMTEIIAGDSPARIVLDAKTLFSDLKLTENRIIWDLNNDGIEETGKENKSFFSYTFPQGQLYTVTYRLPGSVFPQYVYAFPLRVLDSTVPACVISTQRTDNGNYAFQGTWPDGGTDIADVHFEVYDITKEQVIQSIPAQTPQFTYAFPSNDQYIIRLVYTTLEKKKGFCESDTINANSASYVFNTSLFAKVPTDTVYAPIDNNTGTSVSIKDMTIIATQAPIDIQVRLDSIVPQPPKDAKVSVLLGDQSLQAIKSNLFGARVYGPATQKLKVFIDDGKGNTTAKEWSIVFQQPAIQGSLSADKVTGTDPLTVSFDASTITTTRPNDEIIYFTWNFGDGASAKNISQAKVDHVYTFNVGSGAGTYNPIVTVQTKQGYTQTFALPTQIFVTRQATSVSISLPSHPTQIAHVGDEMTFALQTDGYVKGIAWDFGDGSSPITCEDRSCAEVKKTFNTAGTYSVRATVSYNGLPSATNTIKVKIE